MDYWLCPHDQLQKGTVAAKCIFVDTYFLLLFSYICKIPEMIVINQVSSGEYELALLYDSTEVHGSFCPFLLIGDENFFIEVKGKNGCWMAKRLTGFVILYFTSPSDEFSAPWSFSMLWKADSYGLYLPGAIPLWIWPMKYTYRVLEEERKQFILSMFHHWFGLCFIGSDCQ